MCVSKAIDAPPGSIGPGLRQDGRDLHRLPRVQGRMDADHPRPGGEGGGRFIDMELAPVTSA